MRRAPLENFLRLRGVKCALTGPTQITDNLATGTIYFVERGLAAYQQTWGHVPAIRHPVVGQLACAVSRGLASLIGETASWRIAGLVSTARLLAPTIGIEAAARVAASAARDYGRSLDTCEQSMQLLQISHSASTAVETDDDGGAVTTSTLIQQCLNQVSPTIRAISYDAGGAIFRSLTT